jgi:hypothetical protein
MSLDSSGSGSVSTSDNAYHIQQELNTRRKSTHESHAELEKTRHLQENHSLNYCKHHNISGKVLNRCPTVLKVLNYCKHHKISGKVLYWD